MPTNIPDETPPIARRDDTGARASAISPKATRQRIPSADGGRTAAASKASVV